MPTLEDAKAATEVRRAQARARAEAIAPTVRKLQAEGATSLREIAEGLSKNEIPTSRGLPTWSAVQVQRLLAIIG